jgi:hypothetical protein
VLTAYSQRLTITSTGATETNLGWFVSVGFSSLMKWDIILSFHRKSSNLGLINFHSSVKETTEGDLAELLFTKAQFLLSILCFWAPENVSI